MITLFRSNYDEFNPENNGGEITDIQIESGVLHSFLPAIRPALREDGGERWFKFFVKTDEDIVSVGIDIAKPTISATEEVYIALGGSSEFESDLDKENIRLYGGFIVLSVDSANKKVTADRDVSEFVKVGDKVTFYDTYQNRIVGLKVSSVDGSDITFEVFDERIEAGFSGSSSLLIDEISTGDSVGIWIKDVVEPLTEVMEDEANSFVLNIWYDVK